MPHCTVFISLQALGSDPERVPVEKERSAAAKAELQQAKQQMLQLQQQHQEQIEVAEGRAKAAEKQAAELVASAEAAVAQQDGQLQQVRDGDVARPVYVVLNCSSYDGDQLLSLQMRR